jgi:D-serine deaminase-like pyridoxal phosphate-dependent protein
MSSSAKWVPEDTPYVVIDSAKMERNILKMANLAKGSGVALRPHVKTHKVPAIARMQVEAGAVGITVAKVSEAEVMANAGIKDIFIAYPLVTEEKIQRAIALRQRTRLIIGVDSLEGARRVSAVTGREEHILEVRLEVNTGLRRTGVPYEKAVELARDVDSLDNLELTGIYTYRGAVLDGSPTLDLKGAGLQEGELMISLADRIREQGIGVQDVSLGSTPTARHAVGVTGVTEIRPGTYVFYDRMQARMDACSLGDCAAEVVATVVSRPTGDLAVIDGGSKTFATDVQPGGEPLNLVGFGEVVGHPEAVLERLTEEHGMISLRGGNDLRVGDTLRIIPNHVCSTVNLHDALFLTGEDGTVEEVPVAARGKVW